MGVCVKWAGWGQLSIDRPTPPLSWWFQSLSHVPPSSRTGAQQEGELAGGTAGRNASAPRGAITSRSAAVAASSVRAGWVRILGAVLCCGGCVEVKLMHFSLCMYGYSGCID